MKAKYILIFLLTLGVSSCDFLDPLPNGSYNEDNYMDYPTKIRGFIDKAYNLIQDSYYASYFIGTDAISDDAVYRLVSNSTRLFAMGSSNISQNPFSAVWNNSYQAIFYCNEFLKDNVGINTHYLLDAESDMALRKSLQGDAYALRAWNHYMLLRYFSGVSADGQLLGIPLLNENLPVIEMDGQNIKRPSFEECVQQILKDCDSAYVYLPENNRDYPGDKVYASPVLGSIRYRCFDRVAIDGLRAMVYLMWASPAFNPENNKQRYEMAAKYASDVLTHKLEKESTLGFDPKNPINWSDGNDGEIVWTSDIVKSSVFESHFLPSSLKGTSDIVPTQELVDAFPMANGYPITNPLSGYDPTKPYEGRDPRFYSTIFFDGAQMFRDTNNELLYTFDTSETGLEAPGKVGTSPTGYYIKKYIYPGYYPYDATVLTGYRSIRFMRWEQMCLIFAEAASEVVSPTDKTTYNISPAEAIAYLRSRTTTDNKPGLGASSDPYLTECSADPIKFKELVKNEWRITTCFEGQRYFNLRRWTADHNDLSAINTTVHGVSVSTTSSGKVYTKVEIETKAFPSLWNPLPYTEVRKCPGMVQNKGWESWK